MSEQSLRRTNNREAILERYEMLERSETRYTGRVALWSYFTALNRGAEAQDMAKMTRALNGFHVAYRQEHGEAVDDKSLYRDEAAQIATESVFMHIPSAIESPRDYQELRAQLSVFPVEYILHPRQELFDSDNKVRLRIGAASLLAVEAMEPVHQKTELKSEGSRAYLFCGCMAEGFLCPRHRLQELLMQEANTFDATAYDEHLPAVRARIDGNVSAAIASELVTLEEALPALSAIYRDV